MHDELDELLEEAYLEGYYDSIDDYNDYYESNMSPGRIKKIRAKHNKRKQHNMDRALKNIGVTSLQYDQKNKELVGVAQMKDGPKLYAHITNGPKKETDPYLKSIAADRSKTANDTPYEKKHPFYQQTIYLNDKRPVYSRLILDKNSLRRNNYDTFTGHEYGHGVDMYDKDTNTLVTNDKKISGKNNHKILQSAIAGGFNINKSNPHDMQPVEMFADGFTVKNTKGQNNGNRMRKALNDNFRRQANSERVTLLNDTAYVNTIKELDESIKKAVVKRARIRKILDKDKNSKSSYKLSNDEKENYKLDLVNIGNDIDKFKKQRRKLVGSVSNKKLQLVPRNNTDRENLILLQKHKQFNDYNKQLSNTIKKAQHKNDEEIRNRVKTGNAISKMNIVPKLQ